jgi:hypothetical protein
LCRIITHVGEEYLCDICREHPRFYNFTSVAEVGIGMSCPEAARVILASPDFAVLEEIGEVEAEEDCNGFDGRADRGEIYAVLQDTAYGYKTALDIIYRKYSVDAGEDVRARQLLGCMEYLDPDHKQLFMNYSSTCRPDGKDEYLKRFLAYLIYRHVSCAVSFDNMRARLCVCILLTTVFESLLTTKLDKTVAARLISEEIEYSEENVDSLIFDFECEL